MNDPIVDEVRRIRDAHAARFNYDLDAIFRDIKEREKESGLVFIHGVARQPVTNQTQEQIGHMQGWQEVDMDFLESRREAAERLNRYAAAQGVDLVPFRDEHGVFSNRKRWIDFWLDGAQVGYHLRGEIAKLPSPFATSQSSFRGVWDEAGSVKDLHQALELLRSWLIDVKEVDELTGRMVQRSMM